MFQALILPARSLYAVFLRTLGAFLACFGAGEQRYRLVFRAMQIESRAESLRAGLWAYGRRFLVFSDSHARTMPLDLHIYQEQTYCRLMCCWLISEHLKGRPLIELAREFEEGVPDEVVHWEKPCDIQEESLEEGPVSPRFLPEGDYAFVVTLWGADGRPIKAHRFAFFKEEEQSYLFDGRKGLIAFEERDWDPFLEECAKRLGRGSFTLEGFRYDRVPGCFVESRGC